MKKKEFLQTLKEKEKSKKITLHAKSLRSELPFIYLT